MRKNVLLLGLLSCFLMVYAQKPVELSDISMINLGDGRLYATSTDSKKKPIDGKLRIIKSCVVMKNGKSDGIMVNYSPDGKKTYEKSMRDGVEDGEFSEIWEETGNLKSKGLYVKDRQQGVWSEYNQQGEPVKETVYENGRYVSYKNYKK
jgi:hypothetical protein